MSNPFYERLEDAWHHHWQDQHDDVAPFVQEHGNLNVCRNLWMSPSETDQIAGSHLFSLIVYHYLATSQLTELEQVILSFSVDNSLLNIPQTEKVKRSILNTLRVFMGEEGESGSLLRCISALSACS